MYWRFLDFLQLLPQTNLLNFGEIQASAVCLTLHYLIFALPNDWLYYCGILLIHCCLVNFPSHQLTDLNIPRTFASTHWNEQEHPKGHIFYPQFTSSSRTCIIVLRFSRNHPTLPRSSRFINPEAQLVQVLQDYPTLHAQNGSFSASIKVIESRI